MGETSVQSRPAITLAAKLPRLWTVASRPNAEPRRCSEARRATAACCAVSTQPIPIPAVAGPLYGEEGIVVADCDLRAGLHAKRWFDAVGHYSRADVLAGRLFDRPVDPAASDPPPSD